MRTIRKRVCFHSCSVALCTFGIFSRLRMTADDIMMKYAFIANRYAVVAEQTDLIRYQTERHSEYAAHQRRDQHSADDDGGGAEIETDRRYDHSADKHAHIGAGNLSARQQSVAYLFVSSGILLQLEHRPEDRAQLFFMLCRHRYQPAFRYYTKYILFYQDTRQTSIGLQIFLFELLAIIYM